jgi:hypothetical protein
MDMRQSTDFAGLETNPAGLTAKSAITGVPPPNPAVLAMLVAESTGFAKCSLVARQQQKGEAQMKKIYKSHVSSPLY